MQYTQEQILNIIKQYQNTDRNIIKANLRRLMSEYNIKASDIIKIGFKANNVYSWTNQTSNNIPMFEQSLSIATTFNFSIEEFLKNI